MRRLTFSSEDLLTGTHPASRSLFRTGTGVHDSDTHEGLRAALAEIAVLGWDSDAGCAVTYSLKHRCARWCSRWTQSAIFGGGTCDPGDVLSLAWLTLDKYARNVAAAQAPWAYLWTAVGKILVVEAAAAAMLSERAVHRDRVHWPVGVARLGDDDGRSQGPADLSASQRMLAARPEDDQSPAVAALVGHLAGADLSEAAFWADAVDRSLDVMANARRSYEELCLRRDVYLRDVLGLTAAELAALAALLIGPRKGDRAAQSLLLALHRDVDAHPQDVVGAVDRIAFLTSRRHAGAGALPVPAAA